MQKYIDTEGLNIFKNFAYQYARHFKLSCILDSCQLDTGVYRGDYEFLAAYSNGDSISTLDNIENHSDTWLFGVLGYDLKNRFEELNSENKTIIETPDILFFKPQILISIDKQRNVKLEIGKIDDRFWDEDSVSHTNKMSMASSDIGKVNYLRKIDIIQEYIRNGDVYELNFCVPFSHTFQQFDPISFHTQLLKKSPVPMASYLKSDHLHLCGASMERYLKCTDGKLLSQPIKGTIKKGDNAEEDAKLVNQLLNSEKDRAENVMIVDLVRNDLNRICKRNTVKVDELFGIYSYLQVHQMISTVTGYMEEGKSFTDILKATFPMGSMTGAPKIAAMQYIEELESFKRGWYSGAVGYIKPDGDFDFNVVIRSIICDQKTKTINYNAGGAITIDSDPESEWQEVQLKTKAITEVLNS